MLPHYMRRCLTNPNAIRTLKNQLPSITTASIVPPLIQNHSSLQPLHDLTRSFSTAAEHTDIDENSSSDTVKSGAKRKKAARRRKLAPVIITENAANRLKEILAGPSAEGAIGIRLGVKRRGCNGLSYTLNYAFEKPEHDEELESHGVRVFIEPFALFNVVGTTMDYEETELSSEFTFRNPNSKGECGCGESFTV